MRDSFRSFQSISATKWVVNIRGRFSGEAETYLRESLSERVRIYRLSSDQGWFHDTRLMLAEIESDYVMFWLEDHLNLADIEILDLHVREMGQGSVDYMFYSFWWGGKLRDRYLGVPSTSLGHIDFVEHTIESNVRIQRNAPEGVYLIAAPSIFKTALFKRVVMSYDPATARWPIHTPFDFEKDPNQLQWLPLRVGLPRRELFASIDDDHVHPGSSLISRGLYPRRVERQTYAG
jgi:hypothetical protein